MIRMFMALMLISASCHTLNASDSKIQKEHKKVEVEALVVPVSDEDMVYVLEVDKEHDPEMIVAYNGPVVIVDFYAPWCAPCKAMKPMFESFAKEYEKEYRCYALDIEKFPEFAKKHYIMSVPTIGIFVKGKLVEKIVGQQTSQEALAARVKKALTESKDLSKLDKATLNEKLMTTIQENGSVEDIKALLDAGADANTNQNGLTPLMYVTMVIAPQGHDVTPLVTLLLECGASTEFDTPQGTMQAHECMQFFVDNFKCLQENDEKIAALCKDAHDKKSEKKDAA